MSEDRVVGLVSQIADLLLRCKQTHAATWLQQHLDAALTSPDFDWSAFRAELHVRTIGMGSLSDIYLSPPEDSGLDEKEANRQLRELTERLWRLTR